MNWIQEHAVKDPEALAQTNNRPHVCSYDTAAEAAKALGMPGDDTIFGADKRNIDETDDASRPKVAPIER